MAAFDHLKNRRGFCRSSILSVLALPITMLLGRTALAEQTEAPVPGSSVSPHSGMLDMAAKTVQTRRPIDAMSEYLNGFHFYANDMGRQVEANHFCTHLSDDFHQCVIYDSNLPNAKLIGIEYIVSERVFKSLPSEEKKLWHSHHFEVKSGELIAPGVPELAEHDFMNSLVTTYGKTWHTWQIDRDHSFPMGIPQLMMGFTSEGQIKQSILQARDKRFSVSTAERKKNRANIPMPTVDAGANFWQSGKAMQLRLEEVPARTRRA